MQLTTYVQNKKQIELCRENRVMEAILGHKDFSRTGTLGDEVMALAEYGFSLGLKMVFEWDVLMTENDFEEKIELLKKFNFQHISAIRVQDPGALEYCLEHTEFPIQLVLENGNHNLIGIKKWEDYVGPRLERLILSIEIPEVSLTEYIQELKTPVEILTLGPILLFYSPRKLLSALQAPAEEIWASGASEESPHKGFPLLENQHGTLMFHIKDQSLLEYTENLKLMNLAYARIDLRRQDFRLLENVSRLVMGEVEELAKIREHYTVETTKGYFHVNKTDVLFPKLKNQRLLSRDESFVGEILDVQAKNYFAMLVKNNHSLKTGDSLKIISPQGKEIFLTIDRLRDSTFDSVKVINSGHLAVLNYHSGVLAKSLVFRT